MPDISASEAHAAVQAARAKAEDLGVAMDIAVVDAGAQLKAFVRMNGASLGAGFESQRKARTARYVDMTGELATLGRSEGPRWPIEATAGELVGFPGGIPIRDRSGVVIGAIGVAGSTVQDDYAVAEAGAGALTAIRS